jgi:hypothetical protein
MKLFSVYTLSSPEDNQVRYVGITCLPLKRRLSNHLCSGNPHKLNWVLKLRNQNLTPIIEPVYTNLTFEQATEFEIQFINHLRDSGVDLLNKSTGGECGGFGVVQSEETILKRSAANRGQQRSEKSRIRMSEAQKGRKHSLETKLKMSKAMKGKLRQKGRKLSEEHKRNLSEALKGHNLSVETKLKISNSIRYVWEQRKANQKCLLIP